MTGAAGTGVASVIIIMLLKRSTRALVRCRNLRKRNVRARFLDMILHGVCAFMHAVDYYGQQCDKDEPRNKVKVKESVHVLITIIRSLTVSQENCPPITLIADGELMQFLLLRHEISQSTLHSSYYFVSFLSHEYDPIQNSPN